MAGRKAIYSPAEAKARRQSAQKQYDDENMIIVKIKMKNEDKPIFEQYAKWKGERYLSRMFRNCVERCMREDGWTYDPTLAEDTDQEQPADE